MEDKLDDITYVAMCSHGGCAKVDMTEGGANLTSTLGTGRGLLFLETAELAQFVADIKAGALDTMMNALIADAAARHGNHAEARLTSGV